MAVGIGVGDGSGVDVGIVVAVGAGSAVAEGGIGIGGISTVLEHAASKIAAMANNIDFGIILFWRVWGWWPLAFLCAILIEWRGCVNAGSELLVT